MDNNIKRNYWRIGVKYVELEMFKKGLPYIWGDSVSGLEEGNPRKHFRNNLQKVKIGDIIVAGGNQYINYIGVVKEKPVFLFEKKIDEGQLSDYFLEADINLVNMFSDIVGEDDCINAICIKTEWLPIDCSNFKMEPQALGSFTPLNNKGIDYINKQIKDFIEETS